MAHAHASRPTSIERVMIAFAMMNHARLGKESSMGLHAAKLWLVHSEISDFTRMVFEHFDLDHWFGPRPQCPMGMCM